MSFLQNRSHIQKLHNKINKCAKTYKLNGFVTLYKQNMKTKQIKEINILNFHYTHIISLFYPLYKKHYSKDVIFGQNLNDCTNIIDGVLKTSYFDEKEEFLCKLCKKCDYEIYVKYYNIRYIFDDNKIVITVNNYV